MEEIIVTINARLLKLINAMIPYSDITQYRYSVLRLCSKVITVKRFTIHVF